MSNISAVDESRIGTRRQYEIISGVAYMMAPPYYRHNRIGTNLCRIIGNYLLGKRCKLSYETMVYLDENNKFIPDLVVVCDKNKIKADGIHGAPDLVIEILSPSTKKRDIGIKKSSTRNLAYGNTGLSALRKNRSKHIF